jgi:hypothetical protein
MCINILNKAEKQKPGKLMPSMFSLDEYVMKVSTNSNVLIYQSSNFVTLNTGQCVQCVLIHGSLYRLYKSEHRHLNYYLLVFFLLCYK